MLAEKVFSATAASEKKLKMSVRSHVTRPQSQNAAGRADQSAVDTRRFELAL